MGTGCLITLPWYPFITSLILAALFRYQYHQQLFCFWNWTYVSLYLTCWDKVSQCFIAFIISASQSHHTDTSQMIFITNQLTGFSMMKMLVMYCIKQKMKFSIKGFSSKCGQIRRFLQIRSHLLKKFLMKNFIFCLVMIKQSPELIFVLFVIAFCMWVHQVC